MRSSSRTASSSWFSCRRRRTLSPLSTCLRSTLSFATCARTRSRTASRERRPAGSPRRSGCSACINA
eukprot:5553886-Prymnesium_polylepis.1